MPSYQVGDEVGNGLSHEPPVGLSGAVRDLVNAIDLNVAYPGGPAGPGPPSAPEGPGGPVSPYIAHIAGSENLPHNPSCFFLTDTHSYFQVKLTPRGLSFQPPYHSSSVGSAGSIGGAGLVEFIVCLYTYSTPSPSVPATPHLAQRAGPFNSPQEPPSRSLTHTHSN